jgi:hypothetical protein
MTDQYVIDNLRLKELVIVVRQNKAFFDEFIALLKRHGFDSIHDFVREDSGNKAERFLRVYFAADFAANLLDGVGDPYDPPKAKWYFLSWLFRDAPAQRLEPLLSSVSGRTKTDRQVHLLNHLRGNIAPFFPAEPSWEWPALSEVMLARLEGSRRAKKGGLFENLVRNALRSLFKENGLTIEVSEKEVRLDDETYDVVLVGSKGKVLIPVKTRETMGGGHALLFTRDIHKSITVATNAGHQCLPIVIAESWGGDLASLPCEQYIYIPRNPNQLVEIKPLLDQELAKMLSLFRKLD